MARSAYKSSIEISYVNSNEEIQIDPQFVKYLLIENNYESSYMPVIYLSMSVENNVYTKILENEKVAKIFLRIKRYNVYSDTAIYKKYIEGQFSYILPTADPNYSQELIDDTQADTSYRQITLALMSMEILNLAKSSFNGIYGEVDQNTLILKALEGLKEVVVKTPIYNPTYETIDIPSIASKKKLLSYIFDKCPFYDTNFRFFIDFTRAYLLDMTGEPVQSNDGQLNTIVIDIKDVLSEEAYYEGMETKDGSYYIYVNPADTHITVNKGTEKVANQLVVVGDDGDVNFVDLDINNSIDSTLKQSFQRGENPILYKNMLESNTIVIELVKENIDSLVLTPNKEYILKNYDDYAEYNGRYTLIYKKEVIKNVNGDFGISISLGLRKVGNIASIGLGVVNSAIKKNSSAIGRYKTNMSSYRTTTTTANKKTNSGKKVTNKKSTNTKVPDVMRLKASGNMTLKRTAVKINNPLE